MAIQLEVYQWISLLIIVISTMVTAVKILWSRIEKSLEQNFSATNKKIEDVAKLAEKGQEEIRELERKVYQIEIDLPRQFVAREDYIRGQSVIEAKLDAVANKLEIVQLKQVMSHGNSEG